MIRHVVMFTLSAEDDAQRRSDFTAMRDRITALAGVVPGLISIELGLDLGLIDTHWDVVLISEHESNEALEAYQAHPAHQEAGAFVKTITSGLATVDFEV